MNEQASVDVVDEQVRARFFRHVEVASIFGDGDQTTSGPCLRRSPFTMSWPTQSALLAQSRFSLPFYSMVLLNCRDRQRQSCPTPPASVRYHCTAITLDSGVCRPYRLPRPGHTKDGPSLTLFAHRRGCFSTNSLCSVVYISLGPALIPP